MQLQFCRQTNKISDIHSSNIFFISLNSKQPWTLSTHTHFLKPYYYKKKRKKKNMAVNFYNLKCRWGFYNCICICKFCNNPSGSISSVFPFLLGSWVDHSTRCKLGPFLSGLEELQQKCVNNRDFTKRHRYVLSLITTSKHLKIKDSMFYKNDVTRGITHGYQTAWKDYLDFMLMRLILI